MPAGRPPGANADSGKVGRPETLLEGAKSVVPARPAAALEPHRADRQIEVVVEDHQIPRAASRSRARRLPTAADNPWGAAYLSTPLDHCIDISVQALTK